MPTMIRSESNNINILQPTKTDGGKLVMTQSGLEFCEAERDARTKQLKLSDPISSRNSSMAKPKIFRDLLNSRGHTRTESFDPEHRKPHLSKTFSGGFPVGLLNHETFNLQTSLIAKISAPKTPSKAPTYKRLTPNNFGNLLVIPSPTPFGNMTSPQTGPPSPWQKSAFTNDHGNEISRTQPKTPSIMGAAGTLFVNIMQGNRKRVSELYSQTLEEKKKAGAKVYISNNVKNSKLFGPPEAIINIEDVMRKEGRAENSKKLREQLTSIIHTRVDKLHDEKQQILDETEVMGADGRFASGLQISTEFVANNHHAQICRKNALTDRKKRIFNGHDVPLGITSKLWGGR
jgi:hypothetical protein